MEASLLDRIKRQASGYIHEKYKNARMVLTNVTNVELLTEEATNSYPRSPDAKTMTTIAQASFEIDHFPRIVHVVHRRLQNTDWKQWRQSYNTLVLLEFLITHGPEYFVEAFQCDRHVIQELGTFKHVDDTGFNWGVLMQKKSEHILELLGGGEILKQARLKALKISKEIQGFGNHVESPISSLSPPSSTSPNSIRSSSFKSYTTARSSTSSEGCTDLDKLSLSPRREIMSKYTEDRKKTNISSNKKDKKLSHSSNSRIVTSSYSDDDDERKSNGTSRGLVKDDKVPFRSLSDVGQTVKQRCKHQYSANY